MTLTIPQFVRVPHIQDSSIRYTWDDWNIEAVDMPLDDRLQEQLSGMSMRAVVAFTIGVAEWIIYRFEALSTDSSPWTYLEAAWAQIVDFRYSTHIEIDMRQWAGPVKGPIGTALRRVAFAIQQAETYSHPEWRAGRASKLAEHVISDAEPFKKWRNLVIERLIKNYPSVPDEPMGDVVPREAIDPEYDFSKDKIEVLTNQFLADLDYNANPYLNSPLQMAQLGFKGKPYVFDIEKDRATRVDW